MKFFLVVVAIIGLACADDLSDVQLFLKCCHDAIEGGVPSIPIPTHDPLVIENFTYSGEALLTSYKIGLTNNILYNLVDYTFPVLNATSYHNPERVIYGYDLYWPKLNFTGDWEIDVKIPFFDNDLTGTYNIVMEHVHWSGIFNFTKPGQQAQGYNATVGDFTLSSKTTSVKATITGATGASLIEDALEAGLLALMNHFPESAADFLRVQRFNGFWLGHSEKLIALYQFCGLM